MPAKSIDPVIWKTADKKKRIRMLKAALNHNKLEWNRDRGHPDAIIKKWLERLENAGFEYIDHKPGNSADGEIITNSSFYKDTFGNVGEIYTYYGPTKDYNRFRVTVTVAENKD